MTANTRLLLLFTFTAILLFVADISLGPVSIPPADVFSVLSGGESSKISWEYIIRNYRLPKAITAMLAGIGLSVSGLLMQTLFRNPLAGPYVLGLSSGSSLGAAVVILGASYLPISIASMLLSPYGLIVASCAGAFLVLLAVLAVSRRIRDTTSILIVGLMFGSFATAVISVLTYFSTAEQLQKFTFWSLGNLGNLSWESIAILSTSIVGGLAISFICVKPLNALLLGENYARTLGLNFNRTRFLVITSTSILAGSITAFAGPIAFIGLAVPHIAKLSFKSSDHRTLFIATIILGASIMLLCDILCQIPGTDITLPVNAVSSVIGAPIVVWLLLGKRRLTI
jgi:iron complex transport system permease protein